MNTCRACIWGGSTVRHRDRGTACLAGLLAAGLSTWIGTRIVHRGIPAMPLSRGHTVSPELDDIEGHALTKRDLLKRMAEEVGGRMSRTLGLATAGILFTFLARQAQTVNRPTLEPAASRYLYVWAGDADKQQSDFVAVIDVDRRSRTYGSVVATLPVGAIGTRPHHTEHQMPATGVLWVNGFDSGQTFQVDLRDPMHPRLAGSFADRGPFSHPHSYARLPNGNILATFQHRRGSGPMATGGLVELDPAGTVVRFVPAAVPAIDSGIRPYSLAIVPALDRVVTTATDMHLQSQSRAVQIWRLSDLTLLHTILLPPGPSGDASAMTAEPRVLEDGRTVLVNTFTCGLYRLIGIDGDAPRAEWLYSTPWKEPPFCAIPVVAGHFWVQTNGPERLVVSLDVSDPSHPREVSRLRLGAEEVPHWLALEPNGDRLVITGYRAIESRVLIAHLDRTTGALRRDSLEVDFGREQWPHGTSGRAIPHGAVFSRP